MFWRGLATKPLAHPSACITLVVWYYAATTYTYVTKVQITYISAFANPYNKYKAVYR